MVKPWGNGMKDLLLMGPQDVLDWIVKGMHVKRLVVRGEQLVKQG